MTINERLVHLDANEDKINNLVILETDTLH